MGCGAHWGPACEVCGNFFLCIAPRAQVSEGQPGVAVFVRLPWASWSVRGFLNHLFDALRGMPARCSKLAVVTALALGMMNDTCHLM